MNSVFFPIVMSLISLLCGLFFEGIKLQAIVYLAAYNFITIIVFSSDKQQTKAHKVRVAEKVLLMFAILGGSLGVIYSIRYLRHKSYKKSFQFKFAVIFILQILLVRFAFMRFAG